MASSDFFLLTCLISISSHNSGLSLCYATEIPIFYNYLPMTLHPEILRESQDPFFTSPIPFWAFSPKTGNYHHNYCVIILSFAVG